MWGKSISKYRSGGFGLIEVLIAAGVVVALALLVSQFVTTQTVQQIKIRDSQTCEVAASAIISRLKELDNNSKIDNWLPSAGEVTPPSEVASRISKDIVTNYRSGTNMGEFLSDSSVNPNLMGPYATSEVGSAGQVNTYQLIENATSILSYYYNSDPSFCASGSQVTSGPLAEIINQVLDNDPNEISVTARIDRIDGTNRSCSPWDPIPVNVSTTANTNSASVFGLSLSLSFVTAAGETKSCAANGTFSSGSDLTPPSLTVNVTANGSLSPVAVGGGTVMCGQGIDRGSFSIEISQSGEAGVQYLCRLDYYAGLLSNVNRTSGTGWFLCSMPEAAIQSIVTDGENLEVEDVDVDFEIDEVESEVNFTISNAAEGTYRLHVKSVDVARNESAVITRDIMLDFNRPQIQGIPSRVGVAASANSNLSAYLFQCTNDRNHQRWTVNRVSGISVSPEWDVHDYHAGLSVANAIQCGTVVPSAAGELDLLTASDFSAANTWSSDGPKTAEFIVCDLCNAELSQNPSRQSVLWFLDSTTTDLVPTAVSLSAANQFLYDAGVNSENPYTLSHTQLNVVTLPSPVIPNANVSFHIRNEYNLATRTKIVDTVAFPAQSTAANGIQACQPYGSYQFSVRDGCDQLISPTPTRTYSNVSTSTGASPGYGILFNTKYCPTFLNSKLPAGTFDAGSCNALVPALQDCTTEYNGGYRGDRSSIPSCTFYPAINRSCKYPPCTLPNGQQLEVGETSASIFYNSLTVPCGGSCTPQSRTCQWNGIESRLTGSADEISCTPQVCPTCPANTTECTSATQYPDCTEQSSSPPLYCRPDPVCTAPETSCASCSNGDTDPECRDVDPSPGVMCCGQSTVTCTPPEVECSPPGVDGCPATPNGDGLYCKVPTCTTPAYTWNWPSGGEPPADCRTTTCASNENQTEANYSQLCYNGSNIQEDGCCSGSGLNRTCYTCTTDPVPGQCGVGNGQNYVNAPTLPNHLCASGTPTAVVQDGNSWTWTCTGSNPPSNNSGECRANQIVNGQCGGADGQNVSTAPSANLCSAGTASAVTGAGPWTWTCAGVNTGTTDSCTANLVVNGQCGSADGQSVSAAPSANLCSAGTASAVTGAGPWTWTCAGSNSGSTDTCSADPETLVWEFERCDATEDPHPGCAPANTTCPFPGTNATSGFASCIEYTPGGCSGNHSVTYLFRRVPQRADGNYQQKPSNLCLCEGAAGNLPGCGASSGVWSCAGSGECSPGPAAGCAYHHYVEEGHQDLRGTPCSPRGAESSFRVMTGTCDTGALTCD